MFENSYWIWHSGDYEIFHTMNIHLRREERGMHIPASWKVSTPYATVRFCKRFTCRSGYMICHMNGEGCIFLDGKHYKKNTRIELCEGEHGIEVRVSKLGGLPAILVESDVCPSDESWTADHYAGGLLPVGYNEHHRTLEQNPEIFPFEYEQRLPVSCEKTDGGILYDFGTELFGFLDIEGAEESLVLDLFYGESREEALDPEYTYITDSVSGRKSYSLRQRAFRYVFIKGAQSELKVSARFEYLPLIQKGKFECNNARFNDICSVAVHTFHLNCREAFLDGIKRDRWVWSGDAYQSYRINSYLFADKEIDQRTLVGLLGKEPIEQHLNTIMDYSLLWLIGLYEHYMTYGDRAFLDRIYPMAEKLLEFCETRLNSDGFIEGIADDWTFIDWSDIDKVGAVCAEQMLLIHAYKVMAEMSGVLGGSFKESLLAKSEELKARVNEFYWNEDRGAFIDSYRSGRANVTRHANIFAVMYGIASESQAKSILRKVLQNDEITKITTPYFAGYELDALAKLGEFDCIEEKISSYWGGMIDLGATTVWEEYNPENKGIEHYGMYGGKYEKSLCHAWGAGPIYLFGRYYLGVYPTSAGYETFAVEPNLGGLSEVRGVVPINGGTVTVELNKNKLAVLATKSGGMLVWQGKTYSLAPGETLLVEY